MDYIIRTVRANDNRQLAVIIRSCFYDFAAPTIGTVFEDPTTDELFELFQQEKSVLFVAEIQGIPVGCCGLFPTVGLSENCVELVKFYLMKEYRDQGIGKELFNTCMEQAKQFGFKQVYIESLPEFASAVRIYDYHGFTQLQEPLGNSGHTGCKLWMIKELN